MKKIYLLAAGLLISAGVMAQTTTTTLTKHFQGALANPQSPQVTVYTWQSGNGYVSGTNAYGDLAIVQKFDSAYGVTADGTVDTVKVMFALKDDAGGSYKVTIWEDNAGAPGNVLASQTLTIASIDLSTAATKLIHIPSGFGGLYNVAVPFTGVTIPTNHTFWTGVEIPTTSAAGDTVVVLTTRMSGYTFVDANTHAGAIDATGAFSSYGVSNLSVANAIFPVVTMDATAGVNETALKNVRFYPNPVTNVANIDFGSNLVSTVNIVNLNGQVIATETVNEGMAHVNVAGLQNGMYFYQAVDANGNVMMTSKFIKE